MTVVRPAGARIATGPAIAAVVVVLVTVNLARSTIVPDQAHLWFNLFNGTVVLLIGLAAGMSHDELGTSRDRVGRGVRWGLAAAGIVTVVVVAGGAIAEILPFDPFDDDRASVGAAEMLLRALVIIPVGTVVVEEIVFRGVLLGLLRRVLTGRRALVVSATLFAAWHLFPASRGSTDNAVTGSTALTLVLAGTFVATMIGGLAFGWLRDRSDSLAAPAIAHIGTNSVPLVVAWVIGRLAA